MAKSVKIKAFSIENKIKIINRMEDGTNQSTLYKKYSLSKCIFLNISKNRSATLAEHKNKWG